MLKGSPHQRIYPPTNEKKKSTELINQEQQSIPTGVIRLFITPKSSARGTKCGRLQHSCPRERQKRACWGGPSPCALAEPPSSPARPPDAQCGRVRELEHEIRAESNLAVEGGAESGVSNRAPAAGFPAGPSPRSTPPPPRLEHRPTARWPFHLTGRAGARIGCLFCPLLLFPF